MQRRDGRDTPGLSRDRVNVTVRLSDDEGKTWSACRTREPGFSGSSDLARFGLPRDEFSETGGWPHQLYVREGRRMISDLVMTEQHSLADLSRRS